jgi:hypothetical protein
MPAHNQWCSPMMAEQKGELAASRCRSHQCRGTPVYMFTICKQQTSCSHLLRSSYMVRTQGVKYARTERSKSTRLPYGSSCSQLCCVDSHSTAALPHKNVSRRVSAVHVTPCRLIGHPLMHPGVYAQLEFTVVQPKVWIPGRQGRPCTCQLHPLMHANAHISENSCAGGGGTCCGQGCATRCGEGYATWSGEARSCA